MKSVLRMGHKVSLQSFNLVTYKLFQRCNQSGEVWWICSWQIIGDTSLVEFSVKIKWISKLNKYNNKYLSLISEWITKCSTCEIHKIVPGPIVKIKYIIVLIIVFKIQRKFNCLFWCLESHVMGLGYGVGRHEDF